tara:strand:+ start:301 stop:654 length:354 start_codon:yes stop_codon:yes gene_type:complete
MGSQSQDEKVLRALIREALTATDKREIERIAKRQTKLHFEKQISGALEKELGASFFGTRGKINKFVDGEITKRFKGADRDKDFDTAVISVCKRVLRALYDLHYKRSNLINNMPIPKT